MKINIKNYRNIIDSELKIIEGEINYILGSNESGKTNILNVIQLLDLENKFTIQRNDYTSCSRQFIKEAPSILIDDEKGRINLVNETNHNQFMNFKSKKKEEYLNFIKEAEKEFNNIWKLTSNRNEFDTRLEIRIKEIFKEIFKGKRINDEDWNIIKEFEITESLSAKIKNQYLNLIIDFPITHYVEPIIKAKNESKISYKFYDLEKENSIIFHIFKAFSKKDDILKLKNLNQTEDKLMREGIEEALFEELNKNIKKYFDTFTHIKAYPFFKVSGGEIILLIKSKNEWKYDSVDENERSLGFKTFLRIIMELKAISQSKDKHYYIIDEPEQSLHPFLQRELIEELEKITGNQITIIIASHSPYIVKINDFDDILKCQYVKRDSEGKTLISSFDKTKDILEKAKKYFLNNEETENYYFLKIIFDSLSSHNIYKLMNQKIKKLHSEMAKNPNSTTAQQKIYDLIMLKNFLNEK